MMSDELIESLGELFDNCNEETKINLFTKNCLFDSKKRFDLAL